MLIHHYAASCTAFSYATTHDGGKNHQSPKNLIKSEKSGSPQTVACRVCVHLCPGHAGRFTGGEFFPPTRVATAVEGSCLIPLRSAAPIRNHTVCEEPTKIGFHIAFRYANGGPRSRTNQTE
jgi:hypothetical protein